MNNFNVTSAHYRCAIPRLLVVAKQPCSLQIQPVSYRARRLIEIMSSVTVRRIMGSATDKGRHRDPMSNQYLYRIKNPRNGTSTRYRTSATRISKAMICEALKFLLRGKLESNGNGIRPAGGWMIVPSLSVNRAQVNGWLCLFPLSVAFRHLPSTPSTPSRDVTSTTSEREAVRTLVEILPEKEDLAFGMLGRKLGPCTYPLPSFAVSNGFIRASQGTTTGKPAFFVVLRGFARRCHHKVLSLR